MSISYVILENFFSNFSFFILFVSMIFYWVQTGFGLKIEKFATFGMVIANFSLFSLLVLRWIESGHFPLSNLYESLMFLSWSFTTIHLILENVTKQKLIGCITSPSALFTNAFATFSLPIEMQKSSSLVPALQSNWLMMHVTVMILSYAALICGSLLSIAFLIITKDLNVENLTDEVSDMINQASYTTLSVGPFAFGGPKETLDHRKTSKNPINQRFNQKMQTKISSASNLSLLSTAQNMDADLLDSLNLTERNSNNILFEQNTSFSGMTDRNSLNSNPEVPLDNAGNAFSSFFDFSQGSKNSPIFKKFRKIQLANIIDNLSYRILGLGFPLLTIGILSGAVWANEAWGSYWSWDPKETWAFLTWLVFAIYLHTRFTKGWQGKKPAIIASLGFVTVWVCFLGVNLIGEGLHSYGWIHSL
uniref:Cytochrome c biogenesis protein CcsA n=1 Tax=Bracteacoccus aerius TaxID=50041 RepID=A0A140HAN6_9CHLO|nr:heme attachment to plastid cytochrome c [Bracteacoccus aerius]AMO01235.1 heme attachment to plastid cytochrome c [Bracteacoccus aerius]